MSDLKPCPFCNTDDETSIDVVRQPGREEWRVVCVDCCVEGPLKASRVEAAAAWNARPAEATIERLQERVSELEAALAFYRDEWFLDAENIPLSASEQDCRVGEVEPTEILLDDKGDRARQALKNTETVDPSRD